MQGWPAGKEPPGREHLHRGQRGDLQAGRTHSVSGSLHHGHAFTRKNNSFLGTMTLHLRHEYVVVSDRLSFCTCLSYIFTWTVVTNPQPAEGVWASSTFCSTPPVMLTLHDECLSGLRPSSGWATVYFLLDSAGLSNESRHIIWQSYMRHAYLRLRMSEPAVGSPHKSSRWWWTL